MSIHYLWLAIAIVASPMPGLAWAQHDAQQTGAAQTPSVELAQCLRAQPVVENIIRAATSRAEAARLSNSPSELRAAVDHLESALRDIRNQSAPCSTAVAPTDPHAGHSMPSTQSPASAPPAQAPAAAGAADPHVGHVTPGAPETSKGTTRSKPPRGPSKPASDPHAGHSAQPSGDKQMDPVNGLMVNPATAPKTMYQGRTYYFSSEESRKEFLTNPAKFARKPKG